MAWVWKVTDIAQYASEDGVHPEVTHTQYFATELEDLECAAEEIMQYVRGDYVEIHRLGPVIILDQHQSDTEGEKDV